MRALAVLAVIGAHAGLGFLDGGYVGVDVFFVVSGFLITGLLIEAAHRDGRVSLSVFYARRARRILPAASVVLVLTVAASLLWLGLLDALDATRDALWAAFFAANIRFGAQGVDYFALEDTTSPLQHYWSLAVEEQFYVVWPLLVLLCFAVARRRARGSIPYASLGLTIAVIGFVSLAWSVVQTPDEPVAAYFSSLTRAWELAAGAGTAVALARLRTHAVRRRSLRLLLARIQTPASSRLLGGAGLAAIAVACVGFDGTTAFPGYAALLPVLGTVALLVAGAGDPAPRSVTTALGVAPLRAIGDWSYSLYLWHWPLIVIPQVRMGRELTSGETTRAVLATFVLAYLTYRWVETPFRRGVCWRAPRRGLVLYPVSLALVLPVAWGAMSWSLAQGDESGDNPAVAVRSSEAMRSATQSLVAASVRAAREGLPIPSDLTPDLLDLPADIADVGECDYTESEWTLCRRGDPEADQVVMITGDSHARAWIPAFEEIAQRAGFAAYYLVKPQCTAAFVEPARIVSGDPWPECPDFHAWVRDQVEAVQPDLMVVATSVPSRGIYTGDGEYVGDVDDVAAALEPAFEDTFDSYLPHVGRLVLLADTPRLPVDPAACLTDPDATLGDCAFPPTSLDDPMREASLSAAVHTGVELVDPTSWLCADDLCPVVVGSTIAYRDRHHISTSRSVELATPLGRALGLLGLRGQRS